MSSPYMVFSEWLFDGSKTSPLPKPTEKINLLKYNSPITVTYLISMFVKNGPLNHYLNRHFNNINLRYLDKEELFKFVKKCVLDFRVRKSETSYFRFNHQTKLFNSLRERLPILKNIDITLLCNVIDRSEEKESIYQTLNIEIVKKKKIKQGAKKIKKRNISLDDFLKENFSIIKKEKFSTKQ